MILFKIIKTAVFASHNYTIIFVGNA